MSQAWLPGLLLAMLLEIKKGQNIGDKRTKNYVSLMLPSFILYSIVNKTCAWVLKNVIMCIFIYLLSYVRKKLCKLHTCTHLKLKGEC